MGLRGNSRSLLYGQTTRQSAHRSCDRFFLSFSQPSITPPGRSWNNSDSLALAAVCVAAWRTARRPLHSAFYSAYGILAGVLLVPAVCMNDNRDFLSIAYGTRSAASYYVNMLVVFLTTFVLVRLTPALQRLLPATPSKLICQTCGYDLRGQIEKRCPECGVGYG